MEINFINVGYGESIVITHNNMNILIDGGSAITEDYKTEERITCKQFLEINGIEKIDVLILSHIHEDHVCGIESLLGNVSIGEIWTGFDKNFFCGKNDVFCTENVKPSVVLFTDALNSFTKICNFAQKENVPVKQVRYKDKTDYNGLQFEILSPNETLLGDFNKNLEKMFSSTSSHDIDNLLGLLDAQSNDTSIVLKVSDENYSCILTGDSCPHNFSTSDYSKFRATIFKLAHHGQFDCLDEELMKVAQPQFVVTSADSKRKHNSANENVFICLQKLFSHKISFLFTDEKEYKPFFSAGKLYSWIKFYFKDFSVNYELVGKDEKGGASSK